MGMLGVGVDVESVGRFRQKPYEAYKGFYERVFTRSEIAYCLGKADPYPHFAARFCAKEALVKAMGRGGLDFRDVEVASDAGRPIIRGGFPASAKAHLSLSHSGDSAVAVVVLEADG